MDLQVITLSDKAFRLACSRLEKAVTDKGFEPESVIAIRNGGCYVADNMFRSLPRHDVEMKREGSRAKSGILGDIVRALPRGVQNALRICEAKVFGLVRSRNKDVTPPQTDLSDISHYGRILIVDDAVDSGLSMAGVVQAVREAAPDARIFTAAITLTTDAPAIVPDVYLYRSLVRFPWSADFKPEDNVD